MEEIITYSLKGSNENSDEYYKAIGEFADEVLLKGDETLENVVMDFKNYILKNKMEKIRSNEEYILELLTLGILWRVYCNRAVKLSNSSQKILRKLVDKRKKGGNIKIVSDFLRGILATMFLTEKTKNKSFRAKLTKENFERFNNYLVATGEFIEEVNRFNNWKEYFKIIAVDKAKEIDTSIALYAHWFDFRSNEILGKYTNNVENYIKDNYKKHKFKEDVVFCARQRVEYHLNMVGAEIMNRAFREDFLKTKIKKLLLPICMRYRAKDKCKAKAISDGYVCQGCSKECRINELTQMGKKHNFEVLLIPHNSSAFNNKKIQDGEVGIIGVACLLNLLSGGWQAKRLSLVPQCVILDYCGCKQHWDDNGIITDINLKELKRVLNF